MGVSTPPARIIAELSKETSLSTGAVESAKFSRKRNFTGPPVQVCELAIGQLLAKRGNSTSIAAVEGPLSTVIGEKGKELKTPRAAIPMFNEAFEKEGTKSLAANRPDVCAGHRCHV